jgi:two-component system alkaline phosphatase synthesis response regulator PhoP
MLNKKTNAIVTWSDDKEEEQQIIVCLQENGYRCISSLDKKHFEKIIETQSFSINLIILDLNIQEEDAISLCNEIKNIPNKTSNPFVVIVSDKNDEYVQVTALDMGADDFILKPIKPRVFLKRVDALLSKRSHLKNFTNSIKTNLVIDSEKHEVIFNSKIYKFPKKQFDLINLLYKAPNSIFSRKEIALSLWEDEIFATTRIIDVHINSIRKTIGNDVIKSVKGMGYHLNV